MALNTIGKTSNLPVPYDSEIFLLERDDVALQCDVEGLGRFYGKNGRIVLTTLRCVFIRAPREETEEEDCVDNFRSYEIPIAYLSKERFVQPIFGANYLEGEVSEFQIGPSKFFLTFNNGT